ncbi:pickpocket protein 28-like, partial [Sitodiplosis mosellana]|uniref:pickpocket protein 28-like n=1 Tax=Sitodiplosis mosellana TaxID=263140 RepID=UPI002444074D
MMDIVECTFSMAPELMTVKNNSNITNWSFEDGYKRSPPTKDYPNRIFNAKQFNAFYIALHIPNEHIEYLCAGIIKGFKLTLTPPGETRKPATYYYQILFSEQAEIFIKPKLVTTSQTLRKYSPSQRQCFFTSERQLRFFRIYTQNNCQVECLSNFTQIECDCVKFSMPRDKNTKICGTASIRCYRNAEDKLFGEDVIDEFENDTVKLYREHCNCLPACTSINVQLTALSIYFADPQVTTLQRIETQTLTDFFANCGGLLGLFLGVSVLSII